MLPEPLLDQVIGSEPALARPAVNQRIIEALDVPDASQTRMHQNAGIEADDVPALMHEPAPPQVLDIAFELDSERPVVPGICQTAINVRTGKTNPRRLQSAVTFSMVTTRDFSTVLIDLLSRPGSRAVPGTMFILMTKLPRRREFEGAAMAVSD